MKIKDLYNILYEKNALKLIKNISIKKNWMLIRFGINGVLLGEKFDVWNTIAYNIKDLEDRKTNFDIENRKIIISLFKEKS